MKPAIRVGVSACLLGHNVRYNGLIKASADVLAMDPNLVELVPFCPEVGAGMPVPRPPIRVERGGALRVVEPASGRDVTRALEGFVQRHRDHASALHGFILKARSPSCGIDDTPHFDAQSGSEVGLGPGIWAACLLVLGLPLIDEARLTDEDAARSFWRAAQERSRRA